MKRRQVLVVTYFIQTVCICVLVCMHVCLCVGVCLFVCMCVRIFQLFQFQVSYRMKNGMCVCDCVRACDCVCVCAWQMVAHICLIALAAKGLIHQSKLLH